MTYDPRAHGAKCDVCPRKGQVVVPPESPGPGAKMAWVGQDPGKNEVALGRPFVGATGRRLASLWEAGCLKLKVVIPRRVIHITNAALCLPIMKDDKEARAAALCCRPRLMREILRLDKHAGLLVMGRWAYYSLTGVDKHIGKYLGFHQQYDPEAQHGEPKE